MDKHQKYHLFAYHFLYTVSNLTAHHAPSKRHKTPTHLTAKEFYLAVCERAIQEYGPLAKLVLERWGLKTNRDLAEAVFHMVEAGIFRKQRHESKDDFYHLPPLAKMLEGPYLAKLEYPYA